MCIRPTPRTSQEAFMRWLPNFLVLLATIGILIGLGIRLVKGGFLTDPVFYWRGSVALLALSMASTLIQIRNK
jgi:hypothetical protein